ncbi:MAG TPA: DUF6603 domain-containing protein [Patescibacteria group bacterium]|nr:DUF6603 domain-containing protein [Patescibacteria group bacterium]
MSFFRSLAREALDFFEFVGDALGSDLARKELIRDLGGDPAAPAPVSPFPESRLASVRAYADGADTSAESALGVLKDIGVLVGAVAANYTAWRAGWRQGGAASVHSLLDLLASNYVRVRYPRMFLIIHAFAFLEEVTTLDAPGEMSFARIGNAFKAAGLFLWHPGRIVGELDPEGDGSRGFDFTVRMLSTLFVILESVAKKDVPLLSDVLYGWDGPGLDVDSPQRPHAADLLAARMATFVMAHTTGDVTDDLQGAERLKLTLAAVPRAHGGPGVFLSLGGVFERLVPLGEAWQLSVKLQGGGTISGVIGKNTRFLPPDRQSALRVGVVSRPGVAGAPSFAFPHETGSRIEIGRLSFDVSLASDLQEFAARITDGAVVIDTTDSDSFIGELLAGVPLRLPFSIALGASTTRGLFFDGAAPPFTSTPPRPGGGPTALAAGEEQEEPQPPELPPLGSPGTPGAPIIEGILPLGRKVGPLTVHEIAVRFVRAPADKPIRDTTRFAAEVLATFSARLGPVNARVDKMGICFTIDSGKPPADSNLGVIDLDVGLRPPLGVAVLVDSSYVSGGGLLFHDAAQHLYAGALVLTLRGGMSLKAVGLVATRAADGSKAFSMLLFITAEGFQPIPIGLGFTLRGIGGMLAIHRTFDEVAMKASLASGTLKNVLFPKDLVHRVSEVLTSLTTLFPARRGCFIFGPIVKIDWGTPAMIDIELAVLYEIRLNRGDRLIILGRLSSILPNRDRDLVRLNMDAFGLIDFEQGTASLDAVLVNSRFVQRFVLTGQMAMRLVWKGDASFALAVGGLHPKFALPAGFPRLDRIALALTTGDNPRLLCQAYIAITPNTIQFGARATLYAAALGFSVEGDVGFDVLIHIFPFHLLADFHASVQLRRGSHNLFKVKVEGSLEAPIPLRVRGKASFEILWCDFSVRFDATLIGGSTPADVQRVDVLGELTRALGDARAWQVQPPEATGRLVSVRAARPDEAGAVLVHPLGSLSVRQSVVPLNLTRDIDRLGAASPSGARRFQVTEARLGPRLASTQPLRELFAPAQFFDMSDEDKLVAPSFESMDAGLTIGDTAYAFSHADRVVSRFEYKDIVIGADGASVEQPVRWQPPGPLVFRQARSGAAGRAPLRRTLTERFAVIEDAPAGASLRSARWSALDDPLVGQAPLPSPTTPVPASAPPLTWVEAQARVKGGGMVLVPNFETLGVS